MALGRSESGRREANRESPRKSGDAGEHSGLRQKGGTSFPLVLVSVLPVPPVLSLKPPFSIIRSPGFCLRADASVLQDHFGKVSSLYKSA